MAIAGPHMIEADNPAQGWLAMCNYVLANHDEVRNLLVAIHGPISVDPVVDEPDLLSSQQRVGERPNAPPDLLGARPIDVKDAREVRNAERTCEIESELPQRRVGFALERRRRNP